MVGNPWKNWIICKVNADEGLVGLGEATGGLASKPDIGDLKELRPHVIGEDPCQPQAVYPRMNLARYHGHSTAMSAIEQACYHTKARSLGLPMWKLYGRRRGARVPLVLWVVRPLSRLAQPVAP